MQAINRAASFRLGERDVMRVGYGAMQLTGPGVFGPPRNRDEALAVLREAIKNGVDYIDASCFHGPHVTNQIIREALHPYRDGLTTVTKVGAVRGDDGSWNPAQDAAMIDPLAADGIAYLPFLLLGGFSPLPSQTLSSVAAKLDATPM